MSVSNDPDEIRAEIERTREGSARRRCTGQTANPKKIASGRRRARKRSSA